MKRNVFRTPNQLYSYRYFYILLMMAALLVLFLGIANLGTVSEVLQIDKPNLSKLTLNEFLNESEDNRKSEEQKISSAAVIGNDAPVVAFYNPTGSNTMVRVQLQITKQPYDDISSLHDVKENTQLLIIDCSTISDSDTKIIENLRENGTSVLFLGIPDDNSLGNSELCSLMGIKEVGEKKDWPGIRTSSDLLTGTMVEKNEYPINGIEVTLLKNAKIYASALPYGYSNMDNNDLPPIIWRYIKDNAGYVYVFNGNFMETEMGYGILPVVLSEINNNYIYPVINAYCLSASGFPYAENEENEIWRELYSRDKFGIQTDLIYAQIKKYMKVYGAKITCFTSDFDTFMTTDDSTLKYFVDEIEANQGCLAHSFGNNLTIDGGEESTSVLLWNTDFQFWNTQTGTLQLPICYNCNSDESMPEEYCIAGFASTMGYFAVNIDYDDFLYNTNEESSWAIWCRDQETMLGTQKRDYGWIERVTYDEAFCRLLNLLNMKVEIEYEEDSININIDNFEDEAWFVLRSKMENLRIDNGAIEEIGNNCYFVTITEKEAAITWEK